MAGPDMTVFVARDEDNAVAMGALKRHPGGIGEVKRMYTLPDYQGRGIGGRILAKIEALARREGLSSLVLETGNNFYAALHVYERAGFRTCGPVLDYPPSPHTSFFEKPLSAQRARMSDAVSMTLAEARDALKAQQDCLQRN